MKDHEKRELVSELVGIASIAHGTEQLRDRIAYALSGVFSAIDGVTVRADKAEAELAKLRKQKPVAYVKYKATGGNVGLSWLAVPTGEFYPREGEPLYAAPVPAVAAPAVPEEWREVMKELADDLAIEIDQDYPPERRAYPSEQRKYEGEMVIVNRARALLQSANHSEQALEKVAPDCRACANRGRINGLSQESFCDSCVWQGMSFRNNHYLPNSTDFEGVKMVELHQIDAARGEK